MKEKLLLLLKTVVFLILLAAAVFAVSLICERKSSYDKNQMFFEEAKKDNIDIFILGSSHVINGINPIQLFEEKGYTAYNLGGYGSVHLSSYWQMMLALDYCTPKLVVIDSYMLENNVRFIDDEGANVDSDELHLNIDRFPFSRTKFLAINDMLMDKDKKYSFWADFMVYHDRWKELTSEDFKRLTGTAKVNHLMGAVMEYGVHSAEFNYVDYQAGLIEGETIGTNYLRRMIEECQKRNIQVAVVTTPYLAMQDGQSAAKTAAQIASEYGVLSVNMLEVPGIVDLNTDMADAGHLNVLGCTKVTSYLGEVLSQNFELTDHREDNKYNRWHEFSDEYYESLYGMSEGNEDIYTQLMMLKLREADKTYAISIRGGTAVYADSTFTRLLHLLGAGEALENAISSGSSYMFVCDRGDIHEFAGDGEAVNISTSMGDLTYEPVGDIYRILYLGEDQETNYLYSDDHAYADVQLLFFEEGQVAGHQYYTSEHFTYEYEEN